MNKIKCFKEDCETYSELIDGEAVGMYCCPECNEWQCNTEECACDCSIDYQALYVDYVNKGE